MSFFMHERYFPSLHLYGWELQGRKLYLVSMLDSVELKEHIFLSWVSNQSSSA